MQPPETNTNSPAQPAPKQAAVPVEQPKPIPAPPTQKELCQKDWTRCTDNEDLVNNYSGWLKVQAECQVDATERAKYGSPDWGSWLRPKFGVFLKGTDYITTGTAVAIDPDVKFQNGFGAMARSEVRCTYDLRARRVVDVVITPR
jgi:hypothetical protein